MEKIFIDAIEHSLEEYLSSIESRSEQEIKYLISSFLIEAGHLGYDRETRRWLISQGKEKIDALCDAC